MEGTLLPHFTAHQLQDPNLFQQPQSQPALVPQPVSGLDSFHFDPQLENQPDLALQSQNRSSFDGVQGGYDSRGQQPPRFHEIRPNAAVSLAPNADFGQASPFGVVPRPSRPSNDESNPGGQMFGVLTPHTQLSNHSQNHSESLRGLQNEIDLRPQAITDGGTTEGHFNNLKMIPNPPLLEEWRQRLFDVDETITLTEDEYVHYSNWTIRL